VVILFSLSWKKMLPYLKVILECTYYNRFRADVEDLIAEGDKVASRATCYGTHKGELMGITPTGRQITVPVICISRLVNNRIVEDFELVDLFGMLQQLGVNLPAGQY